jgi:hypothetical protein
MDGILGIHDEEEIHLIVTDQKVLGLGSLQDWVLKFLMDF